MRKFIPHNIPSVLLLILVSLLITGCGNTPISTHSSSRPARVSSSTPVEEIASLRRSVTKNPKDVGTRFHLALGLRYVGDNKGFYSEIQKVIAQEPKESLYRYVLADAYRKDKKPDQALENALAAARLGVSGNRGNTPRYNQLVGDIQVERGNLKDAEKAYEKAIAQFSAYAPDIDALIYDKKSRNAWEKESSCLVSKLHKVKYKLNAKRPPLAWIRRDMPWFPIDPSDDKAVRAAAQSEITELAEGVREGRTSGADVHYLLAVSYLSLGNVEEAITEALATIELDRGDSEAWLLLGQSYIHDRRLSDAADAFQMSVVLNNQDAVILAQKMREALTRWKRQHSNK